MNSRIATPTEDPAQARRVVRSKLTGLPEEILETAALLTSELVTNAIVHGSGDATLVVQVEPARIHVEVLDSDPTLDLEPLKVSPSSEHGRGLSIVAALATTWGVEPRMAGKAVWFDLQL